MNTTTDLIGSALGGYRIGELIGRGGMAAVHRARDESGQEVAVKVLPLDLVDDDRDLERFALEAALAARILHPNVITIHGSGQERGVLWTAMELAEGESLRDRLRRDGRLSVADVLRVGRQVLAALAAAHEQGVLHRDIKADNIILGEDGSLKVLDFGIARIAGGPVLTRADEIIGTVEYMAPEQVLGDPVGPAADLYAAGVLLYELLTGELPFVATSPATLVYKQLNETPEPPSFLQPGVPRSLDRLVLRLLDKLPEERPDTAAALRQLAEVERRQTLAAMPGSPAEVGPDTAAELRSRSFQPTFVGRDAEIERLVTHVDELGQGGRTVFVAGEAGVGKTRLAEELRRRAGAVGARCVSGSCLFDSSLGPYMPFMDALGELFSLSDDVLGPQERETLIEQLRSQGSELGELARSSTTTAKVRTSFAAAFGRDDGSDAARLRFFDAVFELLATAAGSRPLVLTIEDVHWSDEGSLNLLRHLIQRVSEAPVLVLVTYRPEEVGGNSGLVELLSQLNGEAQLERLSLQRLQRPALVQLADSLFVEADLGDEFGRFLYAQSQGNPFIALEILKLLRTQQVLFCENGLWQVDPAFAGQVLPERVNALVQRRLDQLTAEERELLQLAAVVGQSFTTATLEAACGTARITLLKLLFRLERQHRLIAAEDGTYQFTHSKIREVLYAEIPWELRREYHRAAAAIFEAADRDVDDGLLGHHLFRAERFEDALPHLEHAADDAWQLFSWREAAVLFDQAAESCRQTDGDVARLLRALRMAGRCYTHLAAYDEASGRMTQMQAVAVTAQRPTDEADAVTLMGWLDLRRGDYDEAVTVLRHAVDLAGRSTGDEARRVRGRALLNWGTAAFESGHYAEAGERWQEAQPLLESDPEGVSSCLNNLAVLATVRGDLDEAWEIYEQVLALDSQRQATDQLGSSQYNMAMIRCDQERWDEALELATESLELCRQTRLFAYEPTSHLARGEALMGLGDESAAREAFATALRGFRRLEDALGMADALRLQGRLCRQQQRWDEARDLLERCIEINRTFGESVSLAEALFELGELQRANGQTDAALEPLQKAEAIFAKAEARLDLARVRQSLEELQVG